MKKKLVRKCIIGIIVAFGLFSCSIPPQITSPYGKTPYPYGEFKHAGVDFATSSGTPVIASTNGIITRVRLGDPIGQNMISMLHTYNFDSTSKFEINYIHLEEIFVGEGDKVKRGQLLGLTARESRTCSPPHLHFGIVKLSASFGSGMYYSNTYDPADFWLGGKAQCFDPQMDYTNVDNKLLTNPLPCWDYKKVLMKEIRNKKPK
jgi:murein DD-endopeptidase MepM/ murein hydrolase activator NlpD